MLTPGALSRLPLFISAWLLRRSVRRGGRLYRRMLEIETSAADRSKQLSLLKTYSLLLLPLPERTQEAEIRARAISDCLNRLTEDQRAILFSLPDVTEPVKRYWKIVSSEMPIAAELLALLHETAGLPTPYKKLLIRQLRKLGSLVSACLDSYSHHSQPLTISIEVAKTLRDIGHYTSAHTLLHNLSLTPSTPEGKEGLRLLELLESELAVYEGRYSLPKSGRTPLGQKNPIRVLFLIENALPIKLTGYTVRTEATLEALKTLGMEPLALLRPGLSLPKPHPFYCESDTSLPTNYRDVPLTQFLTSYFEAGCKLIEEFQPGVIHAVSNFKQAVVAKALAEKYQIPWTYELRGLWEDSQVAKGVITKDSDRYRLFRAQENQALSGCNAVITLSKTLKKHLTDERGISPQKIFLVPNGVSEEFLDAIERSSKHCRSSREKIIFGYFGSFHRYERLHLAISALSLLPPEFSLRLIGDGEEREALKLLTSELSLTDRVQFLDPVPAISLPSLLSDVTAFFLLREESAAMELVPPMKLLEMICFGKPLVLTKREIFREITPEDFPVIWLPSEEPETIASHFKKALELPNCCHSDKPSVHWKSRCEGYLSAWKYVLTSNSLVNQ